MALRDKGQIEEALAEIQKAQQLNQRKANHQSAVFATGVGIKHLEHGNLDKAIEQFKKAVDLAPDYARAHYHLGIALQRKGDEAAAREAFRRARELDPRLRQAP